MCAFAAAWLLWIGSSLLYIRGWIGQIPYMVLFQAGSFAPSVLGIIFAGIDRGRNGVPPILPP